MSQLILFCFGLALLIAAAVTPAVIWLARQRGWVVMPRKDRWHSKPTAIYGGVAIYLALVTTFLLTGPHPRTYKILLACASAMFAVGLWDDIREMRPQLKFLFQLLIAIVAVSLGIRLDNEIIPWTWVSAPLAVLWLVGVTNAINILDNMDGLSSGVVCVAGLVLTLSGLINHTPVLAPLTAALAGAALGFLIYNFNPAKIFMGDCGSLFLGFTLGSSAILSANTASEASSLVISLLVPLAAVAVPIFDTTLVTFQRTSHGRSIAQGGRDHSSHRLVFLGLSERRAVLLLLTISLITGMGAVLLAKWAEPLLAVVAAAVMVVVLVFFGVFLAEVKVYDKSASPGQRWRSPVLGSLILHKKQILQMISDVLMLSAAFVLAWLLRYEGVISAFELNLMAQALPWLLAAKMLSLWFFGLYRGEWRYVSVHDMVQMAKALLAGWVLTVLCLVVVYRFEWYSRAVLVIDLFLSYMMVAGVRSLMRVLREKVRGKAGQPVVIMGAGDGGELLLREIRNNSRLPFVLVGFVDDDPSKRGQVIHGVKVLGSRHDLPSIITKHQVERVFISILSCPEDEFPDVFAMCRERGVICSRIQPMIRF